MTTSTEAPIVPEFVVRRDGTDISVQLRVSCIGNGYLVKTGGAPIYYATKEDMAKAVCLGLLNLNSQKV
jgi:hypothetical protein